MPFFTVKSSRIFIWSFFFSTDIFRQSPYRCNWLPNLLVKYLPVILFDDGLNKVPPLNYFRFSVYHYIFPNSRIWASRISCMFDDRRTNNSVNSKTDASFIEYIVYHSCKTFSTFPSVSEEVIRIDSIARPKHSIVCSGSMTDFLKFFTNPKR